MFRLRINIYIYIYWIFSTLSQEVDKQWDILDDSIYVADVEVTLVNTVKLLREGMIFFT
jgi:hypothetical protein